MPRRLCAVMVTLAAALAGAASSGAADSPSVVAPGCSITVEENNRAVAAFQQMLTVLRHPRCANCHGKIDVFSPEAETTHGRKDKKGQQVGGRQDPSEGITEGDGSFMTCQACHTAGWTLVKKTPNKPGRDGTWKQPAPESQASWAKLSDVAMCKAIKDSPKVPAANFLNHLHDDVLVTLGFEGQRGFEKLTPERPPMSQDQFIAVAKEWRSAMKAEREWPASADCGCVRVATAEEQSASCQKSYPNSVFTGYKDGKPQCGCAEGSHWNRANNACITQQARADEDAADCPIRYPNSIWAGYGKDGQSGCRCPQGWLWNRADNACITQQARADEDAADCPIRYPNSIWAGYGKDGQSECRCAQGWLWNRANNACITQQARSDEDAADCRMKYPNSTLTGYKDGRSQCGCPQGWVWNRADVACVTIALRQGEEAAQCARQFPGSVLESFDLASGVSNCTCPRGQTWNRDRTACVPEQIVAAVPPAHYPPPTYNPPPTYHAPPIYQAPASYPARKPESNTPSGKGNLDACIKCVNALTVGACYVRIPRLAGWGLCLSCTPDGGVEPQNRFIDRDRCPVCQGTGWKLEDFKVYRHN